MRVGSSVPVLGFVCGNAPTMTESKPRSRALHTSRMSRSRTSHTLSASDGSRARSTSASSRLTSPMTAAAAPIATASLRPASSTTLTYACQHPLIYACMHYSPLTTQRGAVPLLRVRVCHHRLETEAVRARQQFPRRVGASQVERQDDLCTCT